MPILNTQDLRDLCHLLASGHLLLKSPDALSDPQAGPAGTLVLGAFPNGNAFARAVALASKLLLYGTLDTRGLGTDGSIFLSLTQCPEHRLGPKTLAELRNWYEAYCQVSGFTAGVAAKGLLVPRPQVRLLTLRVVEEAWEKNIAASPKVSSPSVPIGPASIS